MAASSSTKDCPDNFRLAAPASNPGRIRKWEIMASDEFLEPLDRRRARLARIEADLRSTRQRASTLDGAIAKYLSYDTDADRRLSAALQARRSTLSRTLDLQSAAIQALEGARQRNKEKRVNLLSFRKFFSSEQKQLRIAAREVRVELSMARKAIEKTRAALGETIHSHSEAERRLSAHAAFDMADARKQLADAEAEARRIMALREPLAAEIQRMEAKVGVHLAEYRRLKAELATIQSEIRAASGFEDRLSEAASGAERARIHQECEARFGTGKPAQVIRSRAGRRRQIENNIPKIGRRIHEELLKFDRTIKRLVIDGNNLCYEGQAFIGLGALQALIGKIKSRFDIVIVFDASIRRLMKNNDQEIRSLLGTGPTIHVSPTRSAADEFLMKIVGDDPHSFILSNDRFAEFHDYDVVRSGRVLRFMIAEGRIMVNTLDVTEELTVG